MVERTAPARLQIEDIVVGRGTEAAPGRKVSVTYICSLTDGTMVDNSAHSGRPFEFKLGAGMVIQGWEQGVDGMRVGGRRRLTIPPELAYGERGRPPVIPENATLIFDIELVAVN
jgi:FKBP-type peptidyl-prolyl cis-trans isomerase FkpA